MCLFTTELLSVPSSIHCFKDKISSPEDTPALWLSTPWYIRQIKFKWNCYLNFKLKSHLQTLYCFEKIQTYARLYKCKHHHRTFSLLSFVFDNWECNYISKQEQCADLLHLKVQIYKSFLNLVEIYNKIVSVSRFQTELYIHKIGLYPVLEIYVKLCKLFTRFVCFSKISGMSDLIALKLSLICAIYVSFKLGLKCVLVQNSFHTFINIEALTYIDLSKATPEVARRDLYL